ncbi:hypothetical protein N8I74_06630 [Chitiniphilus purpureus]|uniref:ESPR domain-containing protein n=1 Tax=Chitiniphilus purpureus TaxID=2981137 RepID=A0ABY6DT77_9NEIS|nr:hypothetical protein [Chitiniphilus sp. CD1]UXY16691.1 hypothetical protein N8I74_06630 [Chitiniphilus sp. CD1]
MNTYNAHVLLWLRWRHWCASRAGAWIIAESIARQHNNEQGGSHVPTI